MLHSIFGVESKGDFAVQLGVVSIIASIATHRYTGHAIPGIPVGSLVYHILDDAYGLQGAREPIRNRRGDR